MLFPPFYSCKYFFLINAIIRHKCDSRLISFNLIEIYLKDNTFKHILEAFDILIL